MVSDKPRLSDTELLAKAVEAARAGDKPEARRLLNEAAQVNPKNEKVWLWRASLAITPQVASTYLQHVLRINPANPTAKAWLERLSAPKSGTRPAITQPAGVPSIPASSPPPTVAAAPGGAPPPASAAHGPSSLKLSNRALAPPPQLPDSFECPVCLRVTQFKPERCSGCGSMLRLSVEKIWSNEGANEKELQGAINRIRAKAGWESDYDSNRTLGLIHLNLTDTGGALPFLLAAKRIRPNDEEVSAAALRLMTRPLVLVVDDSLTIRTMVAKTFEHNGLRTKCCASGFDALNLIREEIPKLVMLDVSMPLMDGYQVCKMIKSMKETKSVPVVMLSGNDGFFDKVKGRVAGASDYLTKPFKPEAALRAIRKYVSE